MKRLMVVGYWRHNLGDDLFLKLLMDRYPDYEVHLACKTIDRPYYQHLNLKLTISDQLPIRVINRIFKQLGLPNYFFWRYATPDTIFIILGGSLFIEQPNWQVRYHDWQYAINKCGRKLLIGGNFGPYQTSAYYQAYHDLFSQLDDGCFRDQASVTMFSDLPQIRYAPDVVLTLPISQLTIKKPYYVISAIDLTKRPALQPYQATYERFLCAMIDELLTQQVEVILLGFCQSEGDHLVMQRLANTVKGPVIQHNYDTIDDALMIFHQAQGVIATRFHAMILGWRFNIPTLPIIYSDKTLNVITDYGFKGQYYDIKTLSHDQPNQVWSILQQQPPLDQTIIDQAQQQFKVLDHYLQGQ